MRRLDNINYHGFIMQIILRSQYMEFKYHYAQYL